MNYQNQLENDNLQGFFLAENEVELSSDDEVEDYEKSGKSYDGYYSRVRKEMEGDSDSDDLGNTYLDKL